MSIEHELILRVLFSFMCGYFLCLAGSLTQITTQNSLSSPSTLGFTGLSVLFVIIFHFLDLSFELVTAKSFLTSELGSFIFFVIASLCAFGLCRRIKLTDIKNIILLGIGFNLFIGAIFSIIQFLLISKGLQFPSSIWFGNFRFTEAKYLLIFIPLFALSLLFVSRNSHKLTLLNFGQGFAQNFSVNTQKIVGGSLFLSLSLTAVVICFFGVFSFVGLVAPHILRQFKTFKYSVKKELYFGPFISGFVLACLDLICYHLPIYGAEIPVGMLSAIFGSLCLIILLVRSSKKSVIKTWQ